MLVLWRSLVIHVAGIPFVAKGWNRVDAPMNEDAELRIAIPLGRFVVPQRLPVGTERAVVNHFVRVLENSCSLRVILRAGLTPKLVDRGRIIGSGRSRRIAGKRGC